MCNPEYTSGRGTPFCGAANFAEHTVQRNRIIVAEDDGGAYPHLEAMLAREYALVAFARNGADLVAEISRLQPDVVIMDISMPVMNGFEAVRRMTSHGARARVVFFTTNGSPAYVSMAFRSGASAYILRASAGEDLPAGLRAALAGRSFVSPAIDYIAPPPA